jgi:peptidoglycan LD-endopeptidase LytH
MDVENLMKKMTAIIFFIIVTSVALGIYFLYREYYFVNVRSRKVTQFLMNPGSQQEFIQSALTRCGDAPFLMPTSGLIGFIWDDSYRPGHHHQGIDIFSGTAVGETPIYAAYEGYLTRLAVWKSTVIIRIPSDPLQPDRQIWTYYTHMAYSTGSSLIANDFPPGTSEKYVAAGTFLGYQGNYSGKPVSPTGVHLHFSIVKDDGKGMFLNEMEFNNTLDPSPYFGLSLNANENREDIPICSKP